MGHVRYGSVADIGDQIWDVRFAPESRHAQPDDRCLLSASDGHWCALFEAAGSAEPTPALFPLAWSVGSVAFLEAECTARANDRCIFGLDPAFGVDDVLEVGLQGPTGHDFCRVGNFDQSFVVTGHQQTRIDVKC